MKKMQLDLKHKRLIHTIRFIITSLQPLIITYNIRQESDVKSQENKH